jgi:IclR family acetate operon transcriptional repressor
VTIKRGQSTEGARSTRTKAAPVVKTRDKDQYFSRAVSKALETLEALQTGDGPMALNEVAQRLQLSKTSTFRLLRTLETSGCLVASEMGRYALAPGMNSVVSTQTVARLLRAGIPLLQQLSRQLRETTSLAALFDNRSEVIAVVESPQPIRMSNIVGHILPPNASSLGKAITAFQNEERREKLLRSYGVYRFTKHTITDRNELDREFARVREQKFATDLEESVSDGHCFGVPIFGRGGEVNAAVSVSLPKARAGDAALRETILEVLRVTAEQIAVQLHGGKGVK